MNLSCHEALVIIHSQVSLESLKHFVVNSCTTHRSGLEKSHIYFRRVAHPLKSYENVNYDTLSDRQSSSLTWVCRLLPDAILSRKRVIINGHSS